MKQLERSDDRQEALGVLLDGFQQTIWTALPCIVDKFDPVKQTCELQPSVQGIKTDKDGTQTNANLPLLVDVPVYRLRGAGLSATVPIVKGDEGLVIFSSLCIDNWYQNGGIQAQFEQRRHDLSDGFFLPGFNCQPKKLANFATDAFEIRNDAGDVKVKVKVDEIDVQVTTDVTAKFTNTTIDMKVKNNSALHMEDGKLALTATEIKFNGIVWDTHRHSGVQVGGGNTGGPL